MYGNALPEHLWSSYYYRVSNLALSCIVTQRYHWVGNHSLSLMVTLRYYYRPDVRAGTWNNMGNTCWLPCALSSG